jgi:hypothetical protein
MTSAGSGGSGGSVPDSGHGGQPYLELCGIVVFCHDGALQGMYGNFCAEFTGVCQLGCRVSFASSADLSLDPVQFAQTLCISPADAGDAASDAGPGAPFECGGQTCAAGVSYCRERVGHINGADGGRFPTTYNCSSFDSNCTARDCSCVPPHQGDTECPMVDCERNDAGQVTAHCEAI